MKLYYSNINNFNNFNGFQTLSFERQNKVNRYLKQEDKLRCLVASLMMEYISKDYPSSNICISQFGKPYLTNCNTHFNISHSGDYVVLGLSNSPIGVDIEKVQPYNEKVAKRCFVSDELSWLNHQGDTRSFYMLWTAKESIMKATGLGFNMPPESFHVMPMDTSLHTINNESWYLNWFSLKDYEICTATSHEVKSSNLIILNELTLSDLIK